MIRHLPRAVMAALAGAIAGAAFLTLVYSRDPAVTFEMSRQPPPFVSGLYPPEGNPSETFAWSRRQIGIELAGLDRRTEWTCVVRFRGGRPAPHPQPVVDVAVDGIRVAGATATNEYQDLDVRTPVRIDRTGLTLAVSIDPVFVPGPGDSRQLGVQVDRIACQPAGDAFVLPPRAALIAATMGGALMGAAFALTGLLLPAAAGGAVAVSALQALALAAGPAPFGSYPDLVTRLALWIFAVVVGITMVLGTARRLDLTSEARAVIAFSAGAVFIKLLGLLHPLKTIIDALFHAHRLEWVLDGRYFFTQPMPSGVSFPYAIALYVFAAPWAGVTDDHIALLRIVVCVSEAAAAALLYPVLADATGNRRLAAFAVVVFHFISIPYVVAGNANLTYAFGESAALVTMMALVWHAGRGTLPTGAVLLAAVWLAFLSHVGVFPVLFVKLVVAAALLRIIGGVGQRRAALGVIGATMLAAVLSTVVYYGHFAEVYQSLDRVLGRGTPTVSVPDRPMAGGTPPADSSAPVRGLRPPTIVGRVAGDIAHLGWNMGWAILSLAVLGLWRVLTRHRRDRLVVVLLAWLVSYLAFLAFAVLAPVEPRFERYTTEFVGRLNYSMAPAVAILAGYGAMWLWNAGLATRAIAAVLVAAAAVTGLAQWMSWFD